MKFPPSTDIRRIRKNLDVTQMRLSELSGVSQSTIAKIEQGKISASYATVVKLFETLDEIRESGRKDPTAIEVASKGVMSVQSTESILNVSEMLKMTGYSQLPVMEGEIPVGSISERDIFDAMRQSHSADQMKTTSISKIMKESYPIVSDNAPMSSVTMLMTDSNAVLVAKKGKIVGIITNADMLKLI